MYEFSLHTEANPRCVPPKRILAERLLRSVEARNSADQAPKVQLRRVEVRSVSASEYCVRIPSRLPRSYASCSEGSQQRLVDVAHTLKRAARANLSVRMGERFVTKSQRRVTAQMFVSSLRTMWRSSCSLRLQ